MAPRRRGLKLVVADNPSPGAERLQHYSNRGVTGNVGVGTGVALSTPGSVTQIQVATNIVVSASVTADVNNAGVTWSMSGNAVALGATLTDITPTSVTFNAPANAIGAVDATITATSVVNSASYASV